VVVRGRVPEFRDIKKYSWIVAERVRDPDVQAAIPDAMAHSDQLLMRILADSSMGRTDPDHQPAYFEATRLGQIVVLAYFWGRARRYIDELTPPDRAALLFRFSSAEDAANQLAGALYKQWENILQSSEMMRNGPVGVVLQSLQSSWDEFFALALHDSGLR
jgi:hypothetical protein